MAKTTGEPVSNPQGITSAGTGDNAKLEADFRLGLISWASLTPEQQVIIYDRVIKINPIDNFVKGYIPFDAIQKDEAKAITSGITTYASTHPDMFLSLDPKFDPLTASAQSLITTVNSTYNPSTKDKNDNAASASYEASLQNLGIPLTKPMQGLVDKAVAGDWTEDQWMLALRDTKAYATRFANKPAWMDESTYLTAEREPMQPTIRIQLNEWGIPMDEGMKVLADQADKQRWTTDQWMNKIRDTQAYQERFAGKPADMNETQYLSNELAYQQYASQYGIHIGNDDKGQDGGWREKWLFKNNVSPQEFADRAQAMASIRDHPEMFKQFQIELQARGVIPAGNKPLSRSTLLRFVMGQGDAAWHEIWQNTMADFAAVQAGISIGKMTGLYTGLSRAQIHGIADQYSEGQPGDMAAKFNELSDELVKTLPLSEAAKYGITKDTLIQAKFGGPNSAQARELIKRANAQHAAFGQGGNNEGLQPAEAPQVSRRTRQAQSEG